MSENLNKLKKLLAELFQLDQADLDFGIYRIMNARRDEITRFLDNDLLPQVEKAFREYRSADRVTIQAQLDEAIEQAKKLGADTETLPRVKELSEKLSGAVDVTALENEVYSHLFNFFRRYYSEGDFISLRRYKEGVYAIPYEGEEVKLHWANHDQYYIKTSENFRNYTFKLPFGKRVTFKVAEAETAKDNIKAANGNERRFMLCGEEPLKEENLPAPRPNCFFVYAIECEDGSHYIGQTDDIRRRWDEHLNDKAANWTATHCPLKIAHFEEYTRREEAVQREKHLKTGFGRKWLKELIASGRARQAGGELFIRFVFQPDAEKRKQKDINTRTIETILAAEGFSEWKSELARKSPTEKNSGRTLLEKHLTDYTAKNTFDYFIHKDLGSFLRRELDFYIKNEVMHLDDVENETAPRVEQYLSKIKVTRKIAHKLIEFLAQIENFQKKLWLKKKFVVETNYCVTLDRVPNELYPEIAANEAQREEWVKLFAIDEIKEDLAGRIAYSKPLTVEFLKANPFLVLDTRFFDQKFKDWLLASLGDVDARCDGLLVHAENFQTLNLLRDRFRDHVKCIYIDPPYNTGQDDFLYKDQYQRASWLSFIFDRIAAGRILLSCDGLFFSSIDFLEEARLREIADQVFHPEHFLAKVVWEKRFTRSNNAKLFSTLTENIIAYRKSGAVTLLREPRSEKADSTYSNPDNDPRGPWTSVSYVNPASKQERPNLVYTLRNPVTGQDVVHPTNAWKYEKAVYEQHVAENRLYWGSEGGHTYPRLKKFLSEMEGMVPVELWKHEETGTTDSASKLLEEEFGAKVFEFPKPPSLMRRIVALAGFGSNDGLFVDFFAGTGPTGHAVINLNREDGGSRKYILIEMGDYFDTVLVPRIKKVVYSKDWKDGKPVSRDGVSHMFKYIRLESYEDTLSNLVLSRTDAQQKLLKEHPEFREDYMLSYMLDVEGRDSLLNTGIFEDPFNYKLNISTGTVGETRPTTVDLVETFNYLLGLTVHHIDHIRGFRVIQGTSPKGEKVLVIWRNLKEKSNEDLDEFFRRQEYNPKDMEFDLIYVNGDNNLENLRREDETWKVRLIEEDFKRLMFDVEDV